MEADSLSPEERHLFNEVTGVIAEELFARITVKDRLETAEDAERVAILIADGVWYRFEIRERNARPQAGTLAEGRRGVTAAARQAHRARGAKTGPAHPRSACELLVGAGDSLPKVKAGNVRSPAFEAWVAPPGIAAASS